MRSGPLFNNKEKIMQYLYVTSATDMGHSSRDITRAIGNITGSFLYSLIEGIQKKDFGYATITDVARKIRDCKEQYFSEGSSFVDSAGYSILSGVVEPSKIPAVIDCYSYYAEQELDHYGYLFSLDIPSSIKYPVLNKADTIYDLNKKALCRLRDLIVAYPRLREKLYFVWHFKIVEQYEIWKHLYKELELSRFVNNRAIGGMVGLHGKTQIKFSPFTAISYRCLKDYLEAGDFSNDFRLHFLGMYLNYDRFHIAFLEKLFGRYLQDISKVLMSYDSINMAHTARMNSIKPFYYFENDELKTFARVTDAPATIIEALYEDQETIYAEIERYRCDDQRLRNASSFVPLRVYSSICLDRFFEWVIDRYELVELIYYCKSPTTLNGKLHTVLKDMKKQWPDVFNKSVCNSIAENLEITYQYHKWFIQNRDYGLLDEMIKLFINRIGYPLRLQ